METPDDAIPEPVDEREEEQAAAAEARDIGGPVDRLPTDVVEPEESDPARQPVYEAGGGEAEGFEQAEALHRDRAENARGPSPQVNAGREEPEDPQSTYGEADDVENVTERY